MPTSSTFYLNAPSFTSATAAFTDSSMTTCAADGYYTNGFIVRQQVGCVMLPVQNCPNCGTPCGGSISATGGVGVYQLNLDAGSLSTSVGAVIVKFNPQAIPDGIKAVYNGSTYNKLSSPFFGYIAGTDPLGPTYTGNASSSCTILNSGGSISAAKYLYNGTSFVNTGTTETVVVTTNQVVNKPSGTGICVMVIPKTSATPSNINFFIYGLCSSTLFDISVSCPALLPSFSSTVMQTTEPTSTICSVPLNQTFYFTRVHNTVDSFVGLYDWVFTDAYGSTPLPDGWYRINNLASPNDTIRVQNGVVTTLYDKCA